MITQTKIATFMNLQGWKNHAPLFHFSSVAILTQSHQVLFGSYNNLPDLSLQLWRISTHAYFQICISSYSHFSQLANIALGTFAIQSIRRLRPQSIRELPLTYLLEILVSTRPLGPKEHHLTLNHPCLEAWADPVLIRVSLQHDTHNKCVWLGWNCCQKFWN